MKREWLSPAKLNLFLYITGRRYDGYHCVQTLFQLLDYGDVITITPTKDGRIRLLTPINSVADKDNLIIRAARYLQIYCWPKANACTPGVDISLKKVLPIGGGLGGASSNTATVLVALNHAWQCGLTLETLAHLGLNLGADVPVFVRGHSAFAEGIGEQLQPVNLLEKWYLVAMPPICITTTSVFNNPDLKRDSSYRSFEQLLATPFHNVCESLVIKHFNIVKQHLLWLLKYAPARITGTGSCAFAEFDTEKSARKVQILAPLWMRTIIARGVNVSPLHYNHALSVAY